MSKLFAAIVGILAVCTFSLVFGGNDKLNDDVTDILHEVSPDHVPEMSGKKKPRMRLVLVPGDGNNGYANVVRGEDKRLRKNLPSSSKDKVARAQWGTGMWGRSLNGNNGNDLEALKNGEIGKPQGEGLWGRSLPNENDVSVDLPSSNELSKRQTGMWGRSIRVKSDGILKRPHLNRFDSPSSDEISKRQTGMWGRALTRNTAPSARFATNSEDRAKKTKKLAGIVQKFPQQNIPSQYRKFNSKILN